MVLVSPWGTFLLVAIVASALVAFRARTERQTIERGWPIFVAFFSFFFFFSFIQDVMVFVVFDM